MAQNRDRRDSFEEPAFWQEVEREVHVDQLDWYDLALFLSADQLKLEPRAEFVRELRERLRERVRRQYTS